MPVQLSPTAPHLELQVISQESRSEGRSRSILGPKVIRTANPRLMAPSDFQSQLFCNYCFATTVLAMNAYPNGTRVFFWTACGETKYGTVQSTSRLADGTQIILIALDGGEGHRSLPVSSVSKVN